MRLARITTVPMSLDLLIKGQPTFMRSKGFQVSLASADGEEIQRVEAETSLKVHILPLTRTISPLKDLYALWATFRWFRKTKPTIVHSHTPKAGIIGMLAAKMAGIPIRMHTVAGLPLLEATGFKRKVLNTVERLTSWAATGVYPNSIALKDIMDRNHLAPTSKLKVIGNGSSNGIDTEKYSKSHFSTKDSATLRSQLGIQPYEKVLVFVGRIVKDKGINELLQSFDNLLEAYPSLTLLLVGKEEAELDPLDATSYKILRSNKKIIQVGWQQDVRPYFNLADIFVFPSYREGFPNVVMQAAAFEIPSVVTDINGSNEIVQHGLNGLIVPVKKIKALENAMRELVEDQDLCKQMGQAARKRIVANYEQKEVWNALLDEYKNELNKRNIPTRTIT